MEDKSHSLKSTSILPYLLYNSKHFNKSILKTGKQQCDKILMPLENGAAKRYRTKLVVYGQNNTTTQ